MRRAFFHARVSSDQRQSNLVIAQPRYLAPCDLTERRDHLHGFCTLATSHRVRAPWSEITTGADVIRRRAGHIESHPQCANPADIATEQVTRLARHG
jgi:hypothetical protein